MTKRLWNVHVNQFSKISMGGKIPTFSSHNIFLVILNYKISRAKYQVAI
jgi:hypothetical protein